MPEVAGGGAGRAGSSVLCNGKNPPGDARGNITLRSRSTEWGRALSYGDRRGMGVCAPQRCSEWGQMGLCPLPMVCCALRQTAAMEGVCRCPYVRGVPDLARKDFLPWNLRTASSQPSAPPLHPTPCPQRSPTALPQAAADATLGWDICWSRHPNLLNVPSSSPLAKDFFPFCFPCFLGFKVFLPHRIPY